jgi:hypothetical protein
MQLENCSNILILRSSFAEDASVKHQEQMQLKSFDPVYKMHLHDARQLTHDVCKLSVHGKAFTGKHMILANSTVVKTQKRQQLKLSTKNRVILSSMFELFIGSFAIL